MKIIKVSLSFIQLKPRATLCRGSYEECDLPEFCNGESEYCPADVYRKNGIECGSGQVGTSGENGRNNSNVGIGRNRSLGKGKRVYED